MLNNPAGTMSVQYSALSTQTPQEATSRDAYQFEQAMSQYAVSTGPGFPDLFTDNETVSASIAEASGKGSQQHAQKARQEWLDKEDKRAKNVVASMGDAILKGMNDASQEWEKTYHDIADIMDEKKHPMFTPRDLLHVQTLLLNSMVSVDLATRVVSKVSSSVDTLLRLQ